MCQNIYHIQNYEKKIHNAKKNRYKLYVVFFSKNLHTFLDGFMCEFNSTGGKSILVSECFSLSCQCGTKVKNSSLSHVVMLLCDKS